MKLFSCRKKGTILLQVMIMSIILCMISVMVIRWVLSRYTLVHHVQQSAVHTGSAEGYAAQNTNVATWATDGALPEQNDTSEATYQDPVHFTPSDPALSKYVTTADD